jgi:hypothetical protein
MIHSTHQTDDFMRLIFSLKAELEISHLSCQTWFHARISQIFFRAQEHSENRTRIIQSLWYVIKRPKSVEYKLVSIYVFLLDCEKVSHAIKHNVNSVFTNEKLKQSGIIGQQINNKYHRTFTTINSDQIFSGDQPRQFAI